MVKWQRGIMIAGSISLAVIGAWAFPWWTSRPDASVPMPSPTVPKTVDTAATAQGVESAALGPVWFEDMTASSGIRFRHVSGNCPAKPFPSANGSGLAALDYDGDGWTDLYFATGTTFPMDNSRQEPTNRLYRNRTDWQFEDVTASAGVAHNGFSCGLAVGDYDSDGCPDLYVTCFGPNVLLRNQGDGTFLRFETAAGVADERWGASAAFLDYDEDGLLDLYVCNYAKWSWDKNPFCGDHVRRIRMHCGPRSHEPEFHILYHNEGDGTFRDAGREAGVLARPGRGQGVVAADLNQDGRIDLYVTNDLNPSFLFVNDGRGRFRDITDVCGAAYDGVGVERSNMGVDAADVTGDGRPELFVTNFQNENNLLYENVGNEFFQDSSAAFGVVADSLPNVGWGTLFADFDLDGWPDLILTNGHVDDNLDLLGESGDYAQRPLCYRNLAGKRFQCLGSAAGPYFAQTHVGRGLVTADFDNDGDLDVAIGHQDDLPAVLRNTALERQADVATVSLRLVGTVSNRDAVGASRALRFATRKPHATGEGRFELRFGPRPRTQCSPSRRRTSPRFTFAGRCGLTAETPALEPGRRYVVIEPASSSRFARCFFFGRFPMTEARTDRHVAEPKADQRPHRRQTPSFDWVILLVIFPLGIAALAGAIAWGYFDVGNRISQWTAPPLVPVSGRVYLNGEPLADGQVFVQFMDRAGCNALGKTDAQGNFTLRTDVRGDFLPGVYVGEHRVMLIKPDPDVPAGPFKPPVITPPECASFETTPLRLKVDRDPAGTRWSSAWSTGSPHQERLHGWRGSGGWIF